MENLKHLKSDSYYENLYDSITVSQCRILEDSVLNQDMSKHKGKEKDKKHAQYVVHQLTLYYKCAERYMDKAETIQEWIEKDRQRDEHLAEALPPTTVQCLKCNRAMVSTSKHLDMKEDTERVLFFYDCPNECLSRRALYEDGLEYIPSPHLCIKCGNKTTSEDIKDGNIVNITYTCEDCGHQEINTIDFSDSEKEIDEHYEEDRKRFCFDQEKGKKAIEEYHRLMEMARLVKEWEERDKNKELYDAVAKINKLTIAEVQKLLLSTLEKANYLNLQFSTPVMEKELIVPFTAIDNDSNRDEYRSRQELQKLFKQVLENSNWRLMSEGINYRSGYVSGRIKCYENEDALVKLVQKTKA